MSAGEVFLNVNLLILVPELWEQEGVEREEGGGSMELAGSGLRNGNSCFVLIWSSWNLPTTCLWMVFVGM